MTNIELSDAILSSHEAILDAVADGATVEEIQHLSDCQRAYKVALLTLAGRVDAIAEVV
jgi:hypothetical protein